MMTMEKECRSDTALRNETGSVSQSISKSEISQKFFLSFFPTLFQLFFLEKKELENSYQPVVSLEVAARLTTDKILPVRLMLTSLLRTRHYTNNQLTNHFIVQLYICT